MVIASKSIPDDLVFPQIPAVEPINWAIRNRILSFGFGCEEENFPMTCGTDLTGRIMMFCYSTVKFLGVRRKGVD